MLAARNDMNGQHHEAATALLNLSSSKTSTIESEGSAFLPFVRDKPDGNTNKRTSILLSTLSKSFDGEKFRDSDEQDVQEHETGKSSQNGICSSFEKAFGMKVSEVCDSLNNLPNPIMYAQVGIPPLSTVVPWYAMVVQEQHDGKQYKLYEVNTNILPDGNCCARECPLIKSMSVNTIDAQNTSLESSFSAPKTAFQPMRFAPHGWVRVDIHRMPCTQVSADLPILKVTIAT
eukprot:762881-Hanusia_phi.AAC.5